MKTEKNVCVFFLKNFAFSLSLAVKKKITYLSNMLNNCCMYRGSTNNAVYWEFFSSFLSFGIVSPDF